MSVLNSGAGPAPKAGVGQGVTIVVAGFLPIMAIVSLAPAIPSILDHFKTTPGAITLIPLIVTAPGLLIAILSPLMGWATDRFGRRAILLVATLAYSILGVAPLLFSTLPEIVASRLGLGVCEAAILTVTNTLLGDYFPAKPRRTWLTVQSVIGPVFATCIIVGCGLATERAWNGAFALYALAFPIFLAMVFYVFEPAKVSEQVRHPELPHSAFPWRLVAAFSAVTLFSASLYYVGIVQIGLALSTLGVKSAKTLGLLISLASVGVPVGAILFGVLASRLRIALLVAMFLALLGVGMMGIGLAPDFRWALALSVVQQVGAGMTIPVLVLWATSSLDARHRGRGMGFWSSAFFLGQFISPLLVGAVRAVVGGVLPAFLVMGVIGVLGAAVAVAVALRRPIPLAP